MHEKNFFKLRIFGRVFLLVLFVNLPFLPLSSPRYFFSFFSAKVDFEFGAHLMFCLSGPVKVFLIFTLNDELCNIVHLNYYKLNFRSNGPKCRFGVSDYHFLPSLDFPQTRPGSLFTRTDYFCNSLHSKFWIFRNF